MIIPPARRSPKLNRRCSRAPTHRLNILSPQFSHAFYLLRCAHHSRPSPPPAAGPPALKSTPLARFTPPPNRAYNDRIPPASPRVTDPSKKIPHTALPAHQNTEGSRASHHANPPERNQRALHSTAAQTLSANRDAGPDGLVQGATTCPAQDAVASSRADERPTATASVAGALPHPTAPAFSHDPAATTPRGSDWRRDCSPAAGRIPL
jgi:hypothetical protein